MAIAPDASRRTLMAALAALPFGAYAAASDVRGGQMRRRGSRTLVAYFSRSGNTRVVAGLIHRARETDLFEILPVRPYPEDYEQTVEQARRESRSNFKPSLISKLPAIASYDTVYLGFPVWGTTVPPVIRSFLSENDLTGKILIPFITHGGYGIGNSKAVLSADAPQARLLDGFVLEMDQERKTMERVMGWLNDAPSA